MCVFRFGEEDREGEERLDHDEEKKFWVVLVLVRTVRNIRIMHECTEVDPISSHVWS